MERTELKVRVAILGTERIPFSSFSMRLVATVKGGLMSGVNFGKLLEKRDKARSFVPKVRLTGK